APNNVQIQQHSEDVTDMTSEDVPDARKSAVHDHCSGIDEDSSMDVDSRSQPTERTLLSSLSAANDSDNSVNDDGSAGSGNDRQAEDTPISGLDALTEIFGGRGSFNPATLGFGFGHIAGAGNAAQIRSLVSTLKQTDDSTAQFIALQGLVELLAMSTDESFISIDIGELVQVLVNMLKDSDSSLSVNPDAVLLACRCLSNLLEALPLAGSIMCRYGAIEALCSKLFEIEYIDLAEQALLTLEH
ncbi:Ubiquitin fusion degradation protein 4, partial [Coemansia erecta]